MNNSYLSHHGIKGQKWGVRRFQNEDGTLTEAGKRRYANTYDYKQSDLYKNSTTKEKTKRTYKYNTDKARWGTKYANRMQYKEIEEGKDVTAKRVRDGRLYTAALLTGVFASTVLVSTSPALIEAGKRAYQKARLNVELNNIAVEAYANMYNIPKNDKVGVGLGFEAVKNGNKIYNMMK